MLLVSRVSVKTILLLANERGEEGEGSKTAREQERSADESRFTVCTVTGKGRELLRETREEETEVDKIVDTFPSKKGKPTVVTEIKHCF